MNDALWRQIILELKEQFPIGFIANHIGLERRQIYNIQNGDIPKGMAAVKLYTLYSKCTAVHITAFPTGIP